MRRRRILRGVAIVVVLPVVLLVLLWGGIHRFPWLGPTLADGARAVVGPAPVAWAEDVAYGWQDRINRWRHGDDAPHTYWDPPDEPPPPAATASASSSVASPGDASPGDASPGDASPGDASPGDASPGLDESRSFPPPSFEPMHPDLASESDGVWVPVGGRAERNGVATMVKTMVHPDGERPYAVLAVVAMHLSRLSLYAVAGTLEPRGNTFPQRLRTGLVPGEAAGEVIAAFNGGFQTIHGGYAMMVDGHTIGEPREDACTVGLYRDGRIRIRSWSALESETDDMRAYRQTPRCLVERGERHPELANRYNTSWGAVVGGRTVIRRSALGLSEDGEVLFFGMGDALTARSLADAMRAAGAYDVAQLDINHVFPRFVLFGESNGEVEAVAPLCRGFSFAPDDYIQAPMARDFFYVTPRSSG